MKKTRILLVDDHDILMDGIESILNESAALQVCGKASSAGAALSMISKTQPDVIITDISMDDISGLELTKIITRDFPLIKIIVLTMHDSVQHISSLLEAGALGYLLKNVKQAELISAVENVMNGRQYIQQSIAPVFARASERRFTSDKQSILSPREIEIIRLIAQGMTTAAISKTLFLSEHTVETHRKNIGRKTGVKTPVGLLNYARENGLII